MKYHCDMKSSVEPAGSREAAGRGGPTDAEQIRRRSVAISKWTLVKVAVAAAGAALGGCFDGEFLRGHKCMADEECGPSLVCRDGYCAGVCADESLGMAVPQSIEGALIDEQNNKRPDRHLPSCTKQEGADALYGFTAPSAGEYTFSGRDSSIRTVVSVLEGCGGEELVCSKNSVTTRLEEGQAVIVVVSGFEAEVGDFNLNIDVAAPMDDAESESGGSQNSEAGSVPDEFGCADEVLDAMTLPVMVTGDNSGLGDDRTPEDHCFEFGVPEISGDDALYRFTAPAPGDYVIDTSGSLIDTVLSVWDGCEGASLGCNDDAGPEVLSSRLPVHLAMGQTVLIAVDGYDGETGPFQLAIHAL